MVVKVFHVLIVCLTFLHKLMDVGTWNHKHDRVWIRGDCWILQEYILSLFFVGMCVFVSKKKKLESETRLKSGAIVTLALSQHFFFYFFIFTLIFYIQ